MKLGKVAVIGAGAIGSYFIDGLSEKLGQNLWVIAQGERKERLLKNGIIVNQKKMSLAVKTPEEAAGADLIIVAVKYGALQESLPMIKKIVDAHTIVLSPLNGIDSETIIGEKIGMEHLVYSMIKIASQRVGMRLLMIRRLRKEFILESRMEKKVSAFRQLKHYLKEPRYIII